MSVITRRIASLDVLRGLVIVLMALDHIRDFFGATPFAPEDISQTTPALFFTRWITHFCAPVFVFLAGAGAYLYGQKAGLSALRKFLWTRGPWLIALEFLVVNLSWMFNWPWNEGFVFVQVIWAIGVSMLVLAAILRLPLKTIGLFGFGLVVGHNLFDGIVPETLGGLGWLWKLLHIGWSWIPLNDQQTFGLLVVYPLIPWIGVMALGYVFGQVMEWEAPRRVKFLWQTGLGAMLFFILLRATNWYGDPAPWAPQASGWLYSVLSFLNVTKYPPSLLFLCMTLGVGLLLLLLFEKWQHASTAVLEVFGRVPFFFYFLHFSLIHAASRGYFYVVHGWQTDFFSNPPDRWPAGYSSNLAVVYGAWVLMSVGMFFLCRWYARYKFSHTYWWLKYL